MKTSKAKDALRSLGVRPSKERGQNFLTDQLVTDRILEFGAPTPEDTIVEIGPGLGALTKELSRFPKLSVIEIEERFSEELKNLHPGIRVITADVRVVDFSTLGEELLVFGNLPYSFSTDILFHLVHYAAYIKRAILLLQKEFVDRIGAPPGGRDYGVLSVSCQIVADVRLGPIVSGEAFHPPTTVKSRLVELRFLKNPRVGSAKIEWFKKVVKASFTQRRRKLHNSLAASGHFSKELVSSALAIAGIDGNRRAETLSIEEFSKLSDALRQQS